MSVLRLESRPEIEVVGIFNFVSDISYDVVFDHYSCYRPISVFFLFSHRLQRQ